MSIKPFGLAVNAIIDDGKGSFLLLQRSPESKHFTECWETPGGKVEGGESFDSALFREVNEESGLTIALDGVAGVSEFELPNIRIVALYMKAHVIEGKVKLSEEHENYTWLPLKEFTAKKLTPALQNVIPSLVI